MQGRVIRTGDIDPQLFFNYSVGVAPPVETLQYLNDKRQEFINTVANYNQQYAADLQRAHDQALHNDYINRINGLIQQTSKIIEDDKIQILDASDIHKAGQVMRSYIMAEPTLYNLYENNRCSGYDDGWYNNEPNTPAKWRDDYLAVTDGFMEIGEDASIVYTNYTDKTLTFNEKLAVKQAWEDALIIMANGIDPTSPEEEEL